MIRPDLESIQSLAGEYSIIPICREIYADVITPIALLRKVSGISKRYFLLESIEGGEKWGRYSFVGFDPVMRVSCKENAVIIENNGEFREIKTDHPYEVLRVIQQGYRSPRIPDMPPFTGGFVGYWAYAMIAYAEPSLSIKRGDCNDFDLMLFDKVVAYDHLKQKICIVVNVRTDNLLENYGRAVAELEAIASLTCAEQKLPRQKSERKVNFTCNVSKSEYCAMVERAKTYIYEGDIFQAVISRRFSAPYHSSLLNAYRVLRTTNPSPYMVYLHVDGDEIMSTSPETLVRLQNGRLTTFPVAGSRPRGRTAAEDKRLENELLADEKELAEHNMLVDLGRNDLGKISQFSSVQLTDYLAVHRYSTIMHICSQVESNILPGYDGFKAIEAVLPAGTLSGAPKIRACQIIEELEAEPRGIYGGALGYIDFSGNMDTCIAIRMAVKKGNLVYVQAGGGIVADSIPEKEYEESGHKALAVINAIRQAAEVDEL
jgi:anthranilate synthase component 1